MQANDTDWAAIITAIGVAFTAFIGAGVPAFLALWKELRHVKANVEKIEVATNSMKDALVKTTGEAEHAKGKEEARAEMTATIKAKEEGKAATAATLAKGVELGRAEVVDEQAEAE